SPACATTSTSTATCSSPRTRARASSSSTACSCRQPNLVSGLKPKRYLVLAEGFSGDPHFGKTAPGVLRYRRDDVVAVLDSTRAGEREDGLPVVGTVGDALRFEPTAALVGVAT